MPTYDFSCCTCDDRFEAMLSFDAPAPVCPSCGGDTKRVFSSFATTGKSVAYPMLPPWSKPNGGTG